MNSNLKKTLVSAALIALWFTTAFSANGAQNTARASQAGAESIEYKIMVQRATQTAIWAMPAVGIIDFEKATRKQTAICSTVKIPTK